MRSCTKTIIDVGCAGKSRGEQYAVCVVQCTVVESCKIQNKATISTIRR